MDGWTNALQSERARRLMIWAVLPVIVYTLAAGVITWPLLRDITTHAAGAGYGDSTVAIRHAWWAREALLDGKNPFEHPLLVYPDGFTSWLQLGQPVQYVLVGSLGVLFSPVVAFNVVMLLALVLDGVAAYILGMRLSDRRPLAALLGGLVFMAFPAMQGHLNAGHIGIVLLWPLPLLALCLWRVVYDGAGWRSVVWGGVWFALTALGNVSLTAYTLFPLILFAGLYGLLWERARLFPRDVPLRDRPWIKVGGMIALGLLFVAPFYAPLATGAGQDELSNVTETGRVTFSADALAFVTPSPFGFWDEIGATNDIMRDVLGTNSAEGAAYLGAVAVILAAIALARRRAARLWLVVALGAMLFSLGPLLKWRDAPVELRFEDVESYVTLPWAAFQRLPGFETTRTPGRFNLVTGLALSALTSTGAAVLLGWLRRRAVRVGLAALLGVVIVLEYQLFWPCMTMDARQPDYFEQLARADDVRAVLTVPAGDLLATKTAMLQQTVHGKPMIAGHTLRRTPQDPAVLAILGLAAGADSPDGVPAIPRAFVPYLLSSAGVDRVIVERPYVPDANATVARLTAIFGEPEYGDETITVFVVPRVPDPPPDLSLVVAASADGWSMPVDTGAFWGAFLADEGAWYLYTPREQYGDLVFRAAAYRVPRRIGVWLDGHLIDVLTVREDTIRLPLWLDAGYHTLRFEARDGCTDYPFDLLCWNAASVSPACGTTDPPACISVLVGPPTWEPAGSLPTPLNVQLDGGLQLRAYTVDVLDDIRAVDVRLFWESDRPLPGDYALFVHLTDPDSGEPRAQYDGFPALMTGKWPSNTRWQSNARITLPDDLPAGTYTLSAGWFRPSDGVRLGVRGDHPGASADMIMLETVTAP
ncbi:MAG: hypothetical protein JW966_13280 [Anaerolineae bacterium]|nr:hypothetical protein [Anaerolineae bacterium]